MNESRDDIGRLIARARDHQPEAIDRLLTAYRNYLRLLARVWMDRALQPKLDPSDLVQETLLKAYQRFGQFAGHSEAELAAWLRQILARHVVDLVRRFQTTARLASRERPIDPLVGEPPGTLDGLVAASGASPSQSAERRETGVVLADLLAELPSDHREVIVLRTLEQLSWNDVAERMGRSRDAVRMLWVRALKALRPRIEAVL